MLRDDTPSSSSLPPSVTQWLRDGGPEDRGDGEDAEGGTAGESQAD